MKIKSVEVCGFRGFRSEARLDFSSGLNVISGRNGVGKSAVCDAIEYALTGELSKYDPEGGSVAKVQEYVWWRGSRPPPRSWVRLCLIDDEGRERIIERVKGQRFDGDTAEISKLLCGRGPSPKEPLREVARTTIIRDEHIAQWSVDLTKQRRFTFVKDAIGVSDSPLLIERGKAVVEQAQKLLDRAAAREEEVRRTLTSAIASHATTQSAAARDDDAGAALAMLEERGVSRALGPAEAIAQAQSLLGTRRSLSDQAKQLASRARALADLLASTTSEAFQKEVQEAEREYNSLQAAADRASEELETLGRELAKAREVSSAATEMSQLLTHGEHVGLQGGHCPLCDAERTTAEFSSAIERTRNLIATWSAEAAEAGAKHSAASERSSRIQHLLGTALERLTGLRQRIEYADQVVAELQADLRAVGLSCEPDDVATISRFADDAREEVVRLEQAINRVRSSVALEQVAVASARVERVRGDADAVAKERAALEAVLSAAKRIRRSAESATNEMVEERLAGIAPVLAQIYERLRPHVDWREIGYDVAGDVRRALSLTVGDGLDPQYVFSSGQRRSAGLAFLLAIHLSRPWCALKTLVLDDPVQHVDDFRALNLVEVLASIHALGQQVIVTVEDNDLADLIARRVRGGAQERGRRFELDLSSEGGGRVASEAILEPLPNRTLRLVS